VENWSWNTEPAAQQQDQAAQRDKPKKGKGRS